jgi:hypothetical protein
MTGTVIPETPPSHTITMKEQPAEKSTLTNLLILLSDAICDINNIRTTGTGPNATSIGSAKNALEKAKTITQHLLKVEEHERQQTMDHLVKDLKDIKVLLAKPTFAQVTAATAIGSAMSTPGTPTIQGNSKTTDAKIKKQQREMYAIVITAAQAPDPVKNELKSMHPKDMIQKCQSAITEHFKEGHVPKIHGINKLSNDEYRLHCESKDDPKLLSRMDWNPTFNGVKPKKRKYGLVLHGVPKTDLDPTDIENEVIMRDEIEEENTSRDLQVVQVIPLRRTRKHLDKIAAHHSIVIFTHSVEEANACITQGMAINGRFYHPEMYTPELSVTQCYNCYKFGHLAKHCKSKQKCGNCGNEDHDASKCTNNTNCIGCGDAHPAWHMECSKRDEEGQRLKPLKRATITYPT